MLKGLVDVSPGGDAETSSSSSSSSATRRSLMKRAKKFSAYKQHLKLTKDSKYSKLNAIQIKNRENELLMTATATATTPTAPLLPSSLPERPLRVKTSSKWTQEDLTSALLMVKNGTPIKPAAERYRIPVMTLWRRTRALGLVSSKVQCGFRYSPAKGTYASYQSFKSEQSCPTGQEEFTKERSPLTDANKKLSSSALSIEDPPLPLLSLAKLKLEKQTVLKENSPCESTSVVQAKDSFASAGTAPVTDDQNLKVPPKEFLAWLSCLGQNSPSECEPTNGNEA